MSSEELQKKIDSVAEDLVEHSDAVVIILSHYDDDGTYIQYSYRGSWHTVLGAMEHFKASRLADRIADRIKEDET